MPFSSDSEKPFTGLTGKIPKLPAQSDPTPTKQNPLTYYSKTISGLTPAVGWVVFEGDDNKIWHIHHIHIRVNDSAAAGTYTVEVTNMDAAGLDGDFTVIYHDVGDIKQVDTDFQQAVLFPKRIRVYFIDDGAVGGDAYTITITGFVQNK